MNSWKREGSARSRPMVAAAILSLVLFPLGLCAPASATMVGADSSTVVLEAAAVLAVPENAAGTTAGFSAHGLAGQAAAQSGDTAIQQLGAQMQLGVASFTPQHCRHEHHCDHDGPPQVPLPPALWLLGSALIGLAAVARRHAARS